MIEVCGLTKRYGRVLAVENVDFSVKKGEILGFLGPNGAGKSTIMNIITGYISYSEGSVKVDGYDVLLNPTEVKKKIGYLPEQPPLYMDMTVNEYLKFVCDIKRVSKNEHQQQIDKVIHMVRIQDVRKRLIKNLSKGFKQRVGFAQALIGNPEVLILDEPTIGLDPKQIIEIRNVIKDLSENHTIILSSHILPEISAVCERIIIINEGHLVATDTTENLSKRLGGRTSLTARIVGDESIIVNEIKTIEGVADVMVMKQVEEEAVDVVIETEKSLDVRRPLFFAMSKLGCPILRLNSMDMSLEEIFLKLTTEEEEVD